MQVLAVLVLVAPEHGLDLALVLVLVDHPVRVDLAVLLAPAQAAHHRPAKRLVRSVPRPEAAAAVRSIRRPKKAH